MLAWCTSWAHAADEVSAEECRQFADRLSAAIESRDLEACDQLYNAHALAESILQPIDVEEKYRRRASRHLHQQMIRQHSCYRELTDAMSIGATFRPVRVTPGPEPQVVMRLLHIYFDLSYYILTLRRNDQSQLQIVDVKVIGSKISSLSQYRAFARYMPLMDDNGQPDPNVPDAQSLVAERKPLLAFFEASRQRNYPEVLKRFSQLIPEHKRARAVLVMVIRAAAELELDPNQEGKFRRGSLVGRYLELYQVLRPDDPSLILLVLDFYIVNRIYREAIQRINQVNKVVGGDPYLQVLKAIYYNDAGHTAAALTVAERQLPHLDDLLEAHYAVAIFASQKGDYGRAVEALETLDAKFGRVPPYGEQLGIRRWDEFEASPEYFEWNSKRAPPPRERDDSLLPDDDEPTLLPDEDLPLPED